MRPFSRETIFLSFKSILLLMIFAVGLVFGGNVLAVVWQEPDNLPPLDNIPAPLNVNSPFGGNGVSDLTNSDIIGKYNNLKIQINPCKNGQVLMWSTTSPYLATGQVYCGDPFSGGYWQLNGNNLYPNSLNYQIGIGTSMPNKALHVYSTSINAEIDIQSVSGGGNHWGLYANKGDNSFNVWGGSNALTISRNGNIGIGTASPSEKLAVNGKIIFLPQGESGSVSYMLSSGIVGTPILDDRLVIQSSSNRNRLWLDTTGSGSGAAISLASNGTEYLALGGEISGAYGFSIYQWKDFIIRTGGSATVEKFRLTTGGNVGIGTATPNTKLEVAGQAMFGSATENVIAGHNLLYGNIDIASLGNLLLLQKESVNKFVVDSNGNVSSSASISSPQLCIGNDCRTAWPVAVGGGGDSFWATSTNNVDIYNKGLINKVGIGTNSPSTALDIAKATGNQVTYDYVNSGLVVRDTTAAGANVGGTILLTGKYSGDLYLSGAPYIRAYKENSTAGDYGFGLAFGTRVNGGNQIDAAYFNSAGNFGIGTASPDQSLSIQRNTSVGDAQVKLYSVAAAAPFTSPWSMYHSGSGINKDNLVFWQGSNKVVFTAAGDVNIAGSFNAGASLADLAEEFKTASILDKGTVVIMGDDGYNSAKPSYKPHDKAVIGVVSDVAAFVMGRLEEKNKAQIAMVGVVSVKVTDEGGLIKKGDLLVTSSARGYAMRADNPATGTVIGKALEDFKSGEGSIKALINLQ
ncbi:MAG: hypothetical protein WCT26_01225 [Candidatus Buchananbacteria bacterium]|jgi:hypothetical protein